jgi:hypothetical protein
MAASGIGGLASGVGGLASGVGGGLFGGRWGKQRVEVGGPPPLIELFVDGQKADFLELRQFLLGLGAATPDGGRQSFLADPGHLILTGVAAKGSVDRDAIGAELWAILSDDRVVHPEPIAAAVVADDDGHRTPPVVGARVKSGHAPLAKSRASENAEKMLGYIAGAFRTGPASPTCRPKHRG